MKVLKLAWAFLGAAIGLDYYYSKNKFINLEVSTASDFYGSLPLKLFLIFKKRHDEVMSSNYISLSNNYKFKRFTFGYGLSYARNYWELRIEWPRKIKNNIALGLVFPIYFQAGDFFNIGVVYKPTFYRPNATDKFLYEHLISVDFAWKIKLSSFKYL